MEIKKNIPVPVIILNWNGIEDTIKSVESVLQQSFQDFTIFLADNNSSNEEGEILYEKYKSNEKITVILNPENYGFTKAHNLIFEEYIKGKNFEYLILLNNDAFADKDWMHNLISAAKKYKADMVASKMINFFDQNKMDNAGHLMLNTAEVLPIGNGESIEKFNVPFENFGACAGACLYKMEMLNHIGFFDPYFKTGYEDVDLGIRAKLFDYKCVYEPTAIVQHKMSQSIKKVKDSKYTEYIQTSILHSYFKNMPILVLLLNFPFLLLKYLMAIVFNLLTLRFNFVASFLKSVLNIFKEFGQILKKRNALFTKQPNFNSIKLMKAMHFFLWIDFKRAVKFLNPKSKTFFD